MRFERPCIRVHSHQQYRRGLVVFTGFLGVTCACVCSVMSDSLSWVSRWSLLYIFLMIDVVVHLFIKYSLAILIPSFVKYIFQSLTKMGLSVSFLSCGSPVYSQKAVFCWLYVLQITSSTLWLIISFSQWFCFLMNVSS